MDEKAPVGPAMVSRLPKFGGRTSTGGTSVLSNGSTQPTTPIQDSKTIASGTRPNGLIRPSPLSLKWKRDEGINSSCPTSPTSPRDGSEDQAQSQLSSLVREIKNSSPATPKMRRSGSLMVAVSSPKAIPKQSSKTSPKVGTKLGQSPLNGVSKMGYNGSSIPARTVSESRLVRPTLGSISPRSSSQDSLSQSNESLKIMNLDNMVRSNSFTHFKQIPSPTSEPMTRSFSFNRAVELAKPLANTQLRPPRSGFLKPPQLSNGRIGLGLNGSLGGSGYLGGGLGGLQHSRTPPAASSLPNPSIPPPLGTPRSLRKPLLPSSVLNKSLASNGGSFGYRLAQSTQAKRQKPLFPDGARKGIRSSAELLGTTGDTEPTGEAGKADTHHDSDENSGNGVGNGGESSESRQSSGQAAGETLEDMSLSSVSSLDICDTSEECLDDFDCVGDVFSDGDVPDNKKSSSSCESPLQMFVNETVDWESVNMTEHKEDIPLQDSQVPLVLSPEQVDAPQASFVEMSPSNSSSGTYMWDEEGLEPLGGCGTHPLDSYDDSELNSMDILNNLEPSGPGDLDDNDLMLDVDLPEDGLHDFNRMSHNERTERASRQGQRRKQQRWSGPDHFHNDGRVHVFQHYEGLKASRTSSRPLQSEGRQHDCRPMLDEITLEHMTQDCNLLKNQLLRLKTLLQLEETDSPADVSEESEDTASQLEALIKEVQVLREELRSRDQTIAQLTLQCQQLQQHQREQMPYQGRQVRCQCHHQRAPSSLRQNDRQMDKRILHHYDKATQTYWRPPNHAGVLPTPLLSPWQAQHQGLTRTSMPQRRQRVEQLVQYFTDTACLKYYSLSTPVSTSTRTREDW
ncbi:serine-rich coiled-coil domain-containing protein 2 isoform X2 [Leuresthes tenuis]|uniref:serine-rich coiled-coil domain-containing protein 2 isoform X2 n=1 Tax=Leuresthes tenuis TaxID=355514 RepID=UPI003B512B86